MDSNLSVQKLYDMYEEWMKNEHPDVDLESFNYYVTVFRTEFNIGFAPPKIDTCSAGDVFNTSLKNLQQQGASEEVLSAMQWDFDGHRDLARIADRKSMISWLMLRMLWHSVSTFNRRCQPQS